jgi:hypothetical protein
MAKKPEPPKPTTWTIYKIAAKQTWVGTIEAVDQAEAIQKGRGVQDDGQQAACDPGSDDDPRCAAVARVLSKSGRGLGRASRKPPGRVAIDRIYQSIPPLILFSVRSYQEACEPAVIPTTNRRHHRRWLRRSANCCINPTGAGCAATPAITA